MDNEKLESMLIDFIDGKLNEADTKTVEQELTKSEEAYKLYEQLKQVMGAMDASSSIEPSKDLKNSFNQLLEREIAQQAKSKVIFFQPTLCIMLPCQLSVCKKGIL